MLEVEGFVKVNDPIVVLFDVLAVLDARKTWIFGEQVFQQGPQGSQAPQEVQEVQPLLREVFPECWERDRVDLARVSAKIGVPHGILCNIAFEHGLEMSVDEVRAAARSLVASEPVGEEVNTQAAAAPSRNLRARSGEEEKSLEKKWSLPKKCQRGVRKELGGQALVVLLYCRGYCAWHAESRCYGVQSLCGPIRARVPKSNASVFCKS